MCRYNCILFHYIENQENRNKDDKENNVNEVANKKRETVKSIQKKITFESVFNPHAETLDGTQNLSTEQKGFFYDKLLHRILLNEEKLVEKKQLSVVDVSTKAFKAKVRNVALL